MFFSYPEQDSVVDLVFPTIGCRGFDPDFKIQEFSTFGFWREDFPTIDPLELLLLNATKKKP